MLNPEKRAKFVEPPWDDPIFVDEEILRINENATISGMFLNSMVEAAAQAQKTLPSARSNYVRFEFYPQAEHARLLVEGCNALFPQLSTREALRKIGRAAPRALLTSTIGKVLLISLPGITNALEAISRSYHVNLRPGNFKIVEVANDYALVELTHIAYFLDSHHVGVFEGICKHFNLKGDVRINRTGRESGEFLITWRS